MALLIDTHTHVISPDQTKHPLAPVGGKQSDWSRDRPVSHDQLLAALDSAHVDKAVVVQASTAYGNDNSYVVEAVKTYPQRFVGVFSVDVLAPDAVDKIKYWIDAGLAGLRLFTTGSTMPGQAGWLADERAFPAWAYCEANAIPICLQMTADGIPDLWTMLTAFPAIRVFIDHFARPVLSDGPPYQAAQALLGLAAHQGVYLKLTNRTVTAAGSGHSTVEDFFPMIVKLFGADHIAWGSNFPSAEGSVPTLLAAAQAATAMLSQADRDMIFGGTAEILYPALTR
jgi:predicted TIM-barrel fold metal-dependent hydrolase